MEKPLQEGHGMVRAECPDGVDVSCSVYNVAAEMAWLHKVSESCSLPGITHLKGWGLGEAFSIVTESKPYSENHPRNHMKVPFLWETAEDAGSVLHRPIMTSLDEEDSSVTAGQTFA